MEFTAILIVIIIILIGLFCEIIQYFLNKLHMYNTIKGIPGPKAYPIIGNAHLFIGDTEDIAQQFLNIGRNYHSLWRIWMGTRLLVMVDDPEYIKILLSNPNIIDKSKDYKYIKPFAGNGLFSAPVSTWNPHRKLLNKIFLKEDVKLHMDVLVNHSITLIEKLESLIGKEIDVFHYVFRCTLDIIYDGVLDTQLNFLANQNCKVVESIECLMDIAAQRIIKRKKESMLRSIINKTQQSSEQKPRILLDFLFESSHDGGKYSEQDIRDEINTIVIAGSDTSATTISFVLLMLATFPDIQNKVFEELNQIYGSSDPKHVRITHDDIKNMKLLERVIKETLRLFPAGPVIVRKAMQDIKVTKNWTIPKGSSAVFFIYNLHRNEKYWPQPLIFDPDRFLPGKMHSTNFFPFSYGRRNCIGQIFAMLEMKVIIASLLRRFIFKIDRPVAIEKILIKINISLKPASPIKLKLEKRN
ncbi:cytochrome P450 4C1-like isoform X3 [Vespula pensylvanica]|uniref:cytochrome P450 4C1-like isoform X3 n=1 Tax=Vespula pensylvanica TaxID=30213 RepID=UPI001CB9F359|nr:cytochrome P450 4C1-like isoform X3 [Vespula pensylvanica]